MYCDWQCTVKICSDCIRILPCVDLYLHRVGHLSLYTDLATSIGVSFGIMDLLRKGLRRHSVIAMCHGSTTMLRLWRHHPRPVCHAVILVTMVTDEGSGVLADSGEASAVEKVEPAFPWQQERFMYDSSEDEDHQTTEKLTDQPWACASTLTCWPLQGLHLKLN